MRKVLVSILLSALSTIVFAQASGAPAAKPASGAAAQTAPPMTVAQIMDRTLTNLEKEFVGAADAMPEDKFKFAPTQGEFKGVRDFGTQVKHVAQTNYVIFAGMLGEKLPDNMKPDEDNGPANMTSKADIMKFLKDSFALGHRAMATLNDGNLTQRLTPNPFGSNNPGPTRLAAANETLWHSFDHYGQMVEYLRMNGIIPPASRQP